MEALWYDIFREGSIYAYIIIGIGLAMVLLRWTAFAYVAFVARAAKNMGRTKNRYLKTVRTAYDKEILRHEQVDNVSIFVERELSRLSYMGMSVPFVDRLNVQGILLVVCACFTGMVQGYYEQWETQTMGILLLFSLISFTLLLTQENLLSLNEQVDLLEIRVVDYLENSIKGDFLMGERNLQKKERSLLLAQQMEAKMEMAANRQPAADMIEDEEEELGLDWEQENTFMEMLNEFFG